MGVVWKYKLKQITELEVSVNARFLSVAAKGDELFVWVLTYPSAQQVRRNVHVFATGQQIDRAQMMTYVGTAHMGGDNGFVFHVFVDGERLGL